LWDTLAVAVAIDDGVVAVTIDDGGVVVTMDGITITTIDGTGTTGNNHRYFK